MGLGLSISRSTIEAHGGRLWASLVSPYGFLFRFTLAIVAVQRTALVEHMHERPKHRKDGNVRARETRLSSLRPTFRLPDAGIAVSSH